MTEATILVQIFRTTEGEEDETFTVTLSEPRGRLVVDSTNGVATGTITDDSLGVEFIPPEAPRTGDSNFDVVLRFRPAFESTAIDDVKTDIASRLDVHNGDFIPGITAASNNQDFTVEIDPDGTMDVVLSLFRNDDIGGRKMQYDARIDIRGVDTLGVSDAEVQESTAENARKMRFWVRLNQYVGHEITVDYATEDGTAVAGSDYQAVSGTLRFTIPDSRNQEIDVPIIADEVNEGDETSKLKLSNATGATIIDAEGIGTIKNDGSLPMGLISRFGRATASHMVEQVER